MKIFMFTSVKTATSVKPFQFSDITQVGDLRTHGKVPPGKSDKLQLPENDNLSSKTFLNCAMPWKFVGNLS